MKLRLCQSPIHLVAGVKQENTERERKHCQTITSTTMLECWTIKPMLLWCKNIKKKKHQPFGLRKTIVQIKIYFQPSSSIIYVKDRVDKVQFAQNMHNVTHKKGFAILITSKRYLHNSNHAKKPFTHTESEINRGVQQAFLWQRGNYEVRWKDDEWRVLKWVPGVQLYGR